MLGTAPGCSESVASASHSAALICDIADRKIFKVFEVNLLWLWIIISICFLQIHVSHDKFHPEGFVVVVVP